jgi:hypothetical protein
LDSVAIKGGFPSHQKPGKPPCKRGETEQEYVPVPKKKSSCIHHEGCPHDVAGMRGVRGANQDGKLRAKNSTTLVRTLEEKDHLSFEPHVPRTDTLRMLIDIAGTEGKKIRDLHDVEKIINGMSFETFTARRNDWVQEHKGKGGKTIIFSAER